MVAIMTDTNSGITVQEGRENGIYVLPMPVIVDNHCFMEGVDITHAELYEISLCTAGTFVNSDDAAAWNDRVQKAFPAYQVECQELSCSIACHVGCDSLAIAMALRGR